MTWLGCQVTISAVIAWQVVVSLQCLNGSHFWIVWNANPSSLMILQALLFTSWIICLISTGQLVEHLSVCLQSGKSEIQIWDRLNQTQFCQRLVTAATFLWKELWSFGAMTRRWVSQTRYTLRRSTVILIWYNLEIIFCCLQMEVWFWGLQLLRSLASVVICFGAHEPKKKIIRIEPNKTSMALCQQNFLHNNYFDHGNASTTATNDFQHNSLGF